jgi:hypothetical protein
MNNPVRFRAGFFSTRIVNHQATILVAGAIVLIAGFRIARATLMPELPNFSPLTAVAFCGGLLLPGALAWILPFAALFVSDVALAGILGYPLLSGAQASVWLSLIAVTAFGRFLASKGGFDLPGFLCTLVAGSLLFYVVTNSMCWFLDPAYPRSWSGFWACLTVGLPGYPPTWTFFRNSIVSDLIFSSMLLAVWVAAHASPRHRQLPVAA